MITCIHAYIHTYIHTYIHMYTYMHTYIHTYYCIMHPFYTFQAYTRGGGSRPDPVSNRLAHKKIPPVTIYLTKSFHMHTCTLLQYCTPRIYTYPIVCQCVPPGRPAPHTRAAAGAEICYGACIKSMEVY